MSQERPHRKKYQPQMIIWLHHSCERNFGFILRIKTVDMHIVEFHAYWEFLGSIVSKLDFGVMRRCRIDDQTRNKMC